MNKNVYSKSGSALLMVLAVIVVLVVVIADFAVDMRSELKAENGYYENAINFQLAQSAMMLASLELEGTNPFLYANGFGDAYLLSERKDYEILIEEFQAYRSGYELGRGFAAYSFIIKPSALDPNELNSEAWHRMFEIACGIEEGEERSILVNSILDWIDADNQTRINGFEEEEYQHLNPPRHAKNAPLDSPEELLLVNGITHELYYGSDRYPLMVDADILQGGGLSRYIYGDNSPEGRASAQYILQGILPIDDDQDEEDESEYKRVNELVDEIYLVAQGYIPGSVILEEEQTTYDSVPEQINYLSHHIILAKYNLVKDGANSRYELSELFENASKEMIDRILAYGVPK